LRAARRRVCLRLLGAALLSGLFPAPAAGVQPRSFPDACSLAAQDVADWVSTVAAALSQARQIGQLFMVGLQSGAGTTAVDDAMTRLYAGNVVLFGTGWTSAARVSAATTWLQSEAQAANGGVGAFLAGNQEGGQQGTFQAFYGPGFDSIPSAVEQGQMDPDALEQAAWRWGAQLFNAGVNLDLAPVLDTVPAGTELQNAPIGYWGRQLGSDPQSVAEHGVAIIRGLRAGGVAVAPKHFPGLGRVSGNTDFTAQGTIDPYFSGLGDPYVAPYRAAVNAGAEFMMVSSALYPRVDDQRAMFSSVVITTLLRQGLGFDGVVISDDVGAAAAVADLTPAQRALAFFRAGGDMVLTVQPSDIEPMTAATLQAMQADPIFAQQIQASLTRVLTAKARAGLLPADCG
jgi:beta-N-acetylhexosaminidase